MKKSFFYSIAAILALAACSKEADVKVPTGETVTIIASVDQTRSTESDASFSWVAGEEQISVGTSDDEYVAFEVTDAANGLFSHTFTGETPNLLVAVSPVQANADFAGADAYEVELPAVYNNYDPSKGVTNALMIGTPDPNVSNKFLFRHAAALVKVTYANVPVGTTSFVFEADENLTGTVTLGGLTTNDIEITNGNSELNGSQVRINLPQAVAVLNTTLSFYVPVPTGDYSMLNVYLANATGKIASTEKTMDRTGKSPLTLARGDVFYFPTITLSGDVPPADKYYTKVTSDDDLESGQYLIVYEAGPVAFNGGLEVLDAPSNNVSVAITSNGILSTTDTDAAAFTISIGDNSSSIKSASGFYIGQTSDANGLKSDETTAYSNTISIDADGNAVIVSGGAYLRYNSSTGQYDQRFRYYKSNTYTAQKAIALYKLDDNRQAVTMSWSTSEATAQITAEGVSFTQPTLAITPTGLDLDYSSSKEEVATVDGSGAVTVVGPGITTIKAEFVGNASYKPASASYQLTVTDAREKVATPVFTPSAGKVEANSTVTISTETTGATIYYTTGTSNYSDGDWTEGSTVTITEAVTIKAIAVKNGMKNSDIASAQYTVGVISHSTAENPYTIAEVLGLVDQLGEGETVDNVHVTGIVSYVEEVNTQYGNATFYISVDGTENNEFYIYRSKYLEGANFTSSSQIQQGDEVVVVGTLLIYGDLPEIKNGQLVSLNRVETVSVPTFSPVAGAVKENTAVAISSSTEGAVVWYTTGNSEFSAGDWTQGNSYTVTEGVTLKAIAVKEGWKNSPVATAQYTILPHGIKVNDTENPTIVLKGDKTKSTDLTVSSNYDWQVDITNSVNVDQTFTYSISNNTITVTPKQDNTESLQTNIGKLVLTDGTVTCTVTFDQDVKINSPAAGTVLWGETWTGATTATSGSNNATPSANYGHGTTVYNNGTVTYSQSANTVYVRNDQYAGGTKPELMLSSGKTWTISGIATHRATKLSLTYKSNNEKSSVSCSTSGVSISGSSKSYTIETNGAETITLVFGCSANTRIDDVLLTVVE